jgi:hypothetical protein
MAAVNDVVAMARSAPADPAAALGGGLGLGYAGVRRH